ncbi:MAG: hypothetical protein CVU33_00425 [Betaproteobacteria bacterium HGW-Betaproteobacteria-6]|nr:MAG: hypothetical protein CVU33_00425 [Betaproteobacteria bacterium HGW-Betaproteobacteria-6]
MRYSSEKEINKLVRRLVMSGWEFWRGGRHGRLRAPTGHSTISVPCTPSDHRAVHNFRSEVRRLSHGLVSRAKNNLAG